MNYTHLTIEERACLRKYYVEGKSYRKIAKLLGRSPSTISREIARNYTHRYAINTYYPHTAQKKYLLRRSFCHRGMFRDKEVIDYINEKLALTRSPEQIANTPYEGMKLPGFKTIYRWIYEKYLVKGNVKELRRKGKTRKRLGTGGRFTTGKAYEREIKAYITAKNSGIGKQTRWFQAKERQRHVLRHWQREAQDII